MGKASDAGGNEKRSQRQQSVEADGVCGQKSRGSIGRNISVGAGLETQESFIVWQPGGLRATRRWWLPSRWTRGKTCLAYHVNERMEASPKGVLQMKNLRFSARRCRADGATAALGRAVVTVNGAR